LSLSPVISRLSIFFFQDRRGFESEEMILGLRFCGGFPIFPFFFYGAGFGVMQEKKGPRLPFR